MNLKFCKLLSIFAVLLAASAAASDLADFDFDGDATAGESGVAGATVSAEHDYNYYMDEVSPKTSIERLDILNGFDDELNAAPDVGVDDPYAFKKKEKIIRTTLVKALRNMALRRRFSEVLPILRALSKPQRLALAALISNQASAKPDALLNHKQVTEMFGDRKKLLLPIVLDIANLVRSAAVGGQSYKQNKVQEHEGIPEVQFLRRSFDIADDDNEDEGTINTDLIPRGFRRSKRGVLNEEETLSSINEALSIISKAVPKSTIKKRDVGEEDVYENEDTPQQGSNIQQPEDLQENAEEITDESQNVPYPYSVMEPYEEEQQQQQNSDLTVEEVAYSNDEPNNAQSTGQKQQRSLGDNPQYDRLVQSIPFISNMPMPADAMTYHETQLNMTAYKGSNDQMAMPSAMMMNFVPYPSNLTLEQIEALSFGGVNGSDYTNSINQTENLPTPEMLSGPAYARYRPKSKFNSYGMKRRPTGELGRNCERFGGTLCLNVADYPMEMIMGSIRRNRHAMTALLAEYRDKAGQLEHEEYLEELAYNTKRREDDQIAQGAMCGSVVRYARPQKARSASGEWKYIVNTGQHTQTLRLEKCSTPQESCMFLTSNYKSRCMQVFNYHRLLSWDKNRGLHVDIFKVPTCCNCHIDGYREAFPPVSSYNSGELDADNTDYRFSASSKKHTQYTTIHEDPDDDEEDEDSLAYQYSNGFKRTPSKLFTSSQDTKTGKAKFGRLNNNLPTLLPTSPVGAYLTPPITLQSNTNNNNDYDELTTLKRGPNISGTGGNGAGIKRRRPNKRTQQQYDRDQSISESDPVPNVVAYSGSDRHNSDNVDEAIEPKRVNARLPNTASDMAKRVNYNYHPIIDFFEEGMPKTQQQQHVDSRIGYRQRDSNWRPLVADGLRRR